MCTIRSGIGKSTLRRETFDNMQGAMSDTFVVAITVIGAGEDMHGRIAPREAEGSSAEKSPELSRNGPCRESSDAISVELQWW